MYVPPYPNLKNKLPTCGRGALYIFLEWSFSSLLGVSRIHFQRTRIYHNKILIYQKLKNKMHVTLTPDLVCKIITEVK